MNKIWWNIKGTKMKLYWWVIWDIKMIKNYRKVETMHGWNGGKNVCLRFSKVSQTLAHFDIQYFNPHNMDTQDLTSWPTNIQTIILHEGAFTQSDKCWEWYCLTTAKGPHCFSRAMSVGSFCHVRVVLPVTFMTGNKWFIPTVWNYAPL